jgi:hypothetical protein
MKSSQQKWPLYFASFDELLQFLLVGGCLTDETIR